MFDVVLICVGEPLISGIYVENRLVDCVEIYGKSGDALCEWQKWLMRHCESGGESAQVRHCESNSAGNTTGGESVIASEREARSVAIHLSNPSESVIASEARQSPRADSGIIPQSSLRDPNAVGVVAINSTELRRHKKMPLKNPQVDCHDFLLRKKSRNDDSKTNHANSAESAQVRHCESNSAGNTTGGESVIASGANAVGEAWQSLCEAAQVRHCKSPKKTKQSLSHNNPYAPIRAIYYAKGPGSFTALKLTHITLQTLCILTGIKLYSADSFCFNDAAPIRAFGSKYFIKESNSITLKTLQNQESKPFALPKILNPQNFSTTNEPLYILPPV